MTPEELGFDPNSKEWLDFQAAWDLIDTPQQHIPFSDSAIEWLQQYTPNPELHYLSSGACDWECLNTGSGVEEGKHTVAQSLGNCVYNQETGYTREAVALGPAWSVV